MWCAGNACFIHFSFKLASPLREVGLVLGLSQNTIKSHVKAIYRKLDVATRHDAIARGREIGIL